RLAGRDDDPTADAGHGGQEAQHLGTGYGDQRMIRLRLVDEIDVLAAELGDDPLRHGQAEAAGDVAHGPGHEDAQRPDLVIGQHIAQKRWGGGVGLRHGRTVARRVPSGRLKAFSRIGLQMVVREAPRLARAPDEGGAGRVPGRPWAGRPMQGRFAQHGGR
ncbi:MAG: hypothetical protein EBQ89_00155, partial [Alphaproteobacteria bacterium]|nr:hypothetical protein [Alphaproteobacteria bacterium]